MKRFGGTFIAVGTLAFGALGAQAADLRPVLKAPPLVAAGFSWAGGYLGLNAGGVYDRMDVGQLNLTSPGFVFSDPTGAFAGFPTIFFGFPGAFQVSPYTQSGSRVNFMGGGQAGYNWQSGAIVYGVEADFDVMRSRQAISSTMVEFTPGLLPTADITRTTVANISLERQWQASLRGRFGHAWDRLLVYATGGLAVTSLKTESHFSYATTIGPALAPFAIAPPVNLSAAGGGSTTAFLGLTAGAGFEYAITNNLSFGAEYRFTDFGKRNLTLAVQPPAGILLPTGTPIETPVHLYSQQLTARMNYRFNQPNEMNTKAVALSAAPETNWGGCYVGGYAGAAWGRGPVDTFDPSTNVPSIFGPPPFTQTPFYSGSAGLATAPAPYSYNLGASATGGGTLGCNWQAPSSRLVWGGEAEAGLMRLTGSAADPYTVANFGTTDNVDSTRVGNWYGALTGRLGYSVDQVLFYLKGGAGFTRVSASTVDNCTAGALCNSQVLNASGSKSPVFFVVGGGAEMALSRNWSVKAEYLYLGLHDTVAVCGAGSGPQLLPNLTFCSDHKLNGIHTAKVGVNYRFGGDAVVARY